MIPTDNLFVRIEILFVTLDGSPSFVGKLDGKCTGLSVLAFDEIIDGDELDTVVGVITTNKDTTDFAPFSWPTFLMSLSNNWSSSTISTEF